jgi:hypothetical protein
MFKRFFYELLDKKIVDLKTIQQEYLYYPDQRFIETLFLATQESEELSNLIKPFANRGRELYKPAYVHYHGHELYTKHESTKNFFDLHATSDYPAQLEMARNFTEQLQFHIPEIKELDIILDSTPVTRREVAELRGFQFYDSKLGKYEALTPEIKSLNNYLQSNRRSYVFCKPKYVGVIREMAKNGKLNDIFGNTIERIRIGPKRK